MVMNRFEDIEISADTGLIRLYTSDVDYEEFSGNEILAMLNENECIINTIKDAYTNERTELGRSVLKQLLGRI